MGEAELLARLCALEERVSRLEAAAPHPAHHALSAPRAETPVTAFDAAVIGKCVLIVGGAYVLRALTEMHLLPSGAGVALGFGYALLWILRCTTLLYVATGALIAGALAWEAATRFHIIGAAGGGVLIAVTAIVLLWVSHRRSQPLIALLAAVITVISSIGVALGTSDAFAAAITVAVIGAIISFRAEWETYLTAAVAAAGDSIAVTLIALTMFEKTPHDVVAVQIALIAIAALWMIAPAVLREPRWPELAQAVAAVAICLGGAAALAQAKSGNTMLVAVAAVALTVVAYARALPVAGGIAAAVATLLLISGLPLVLCWSIAAVVAAKAWPNQAPFWAAAALVSAFQSPLGLAVAGAAAAASLFLNVRLSWSRLALLTTAAAAAVLAIVRLTPATSRSMLAFEWTALIAVAVAALSLLGSRIPEAVTLARLLLIVAAVKIVVEDLRVGQATTLVASLALYGAALLLFAKLAPRRLPA